MIWFVPNFPLVDWYHRKLFSMPISFLFSRQEKWYLDDFKIKNLYTHSKSSFFLMLQYISTSFSLLVLLTQPCYQDLPRICKWLPRNPQMFSLHKLWTRVLRHSKKSTRRKSLNYFYWRNIFDQFDLGRSPKIGNHLEIFDIASFLKWNCRNLNVNLYRVTDSSTIQLLL